MSAARFAIAADHVFDGEALRDDFAVVVEGARIAHLVPRDGVPSDIAVRLLPSGAWLAPGFIDVQVNGGGDVLFNDQPTERAIAAIAAAHRRFGTTGLLPTLISDTDEKMQTARDAVRDAIEGNPSVLGIHFEGPFLSAEKRGIHHRAMIRAPGARDQAFLTGLKRGVTLVTLAPECVPAGFIGALASAGVRVALGHSMASYDQTRAAIAEGLTGFTHLFNAMLPMSAREPGPVAAALECPACFCGLIADRVHVAAPMLRLALGGRATPMLVTDAMPPVGGRSAEFLLNGRRIVVHGHCCMSADGTLAGSVLDMASAVRNLVMLAGASLPDALRFAARAPAEFLGLGGELGRIARGYRADLVAFAPDTVRVLQTWVAGQQADRAIA
jgi:N-acetylglucosamine-6-phosphate deacetylase